MSLINLALNVIWIIFGGLEIALGWVIAAVLMAVTIIGLPWTRAALTMALYTLAPFGRTVVRRDAVEGRETFDTGPFGTLGNIIWLVLAGWWLALGHVVLAFGCAVTIIGLPFAWAHLKLAGLSLMPVGMTVVSNENTSTLDHMK